MEYGVRAWKKSFGQQSDPLNFNSVELAEKLSEWVSTGTKPSGERYRADIFLYLCLGVQQHLKDAGRNDNIFYDEPYAPFVQAITDYADSNLAEGIIYLNCYFELLINQHYNDCLLRYHY
jgi:hypothetical protein